MMMAHNRKDCEMQPYNRKDNELFARGKNPAGESSQGMARRILIIVILFIILFAIAGRNQVNSCADGQWRPVVTAGRVAEWVCE